MKIAVINGPNLNMLGIREPDIYGNGTLSDLEELIKKEADLIGVEVEFFQSNHEGAIVDEIQRCYGRVDGIILNPAAYTHTSVAILDAIKSVGIPTVEVHLSNPDEREEFRRISFVRSACVSTVKGKGFDGYIEALKILLKA